ncbi:MAG TPA: ATP-dependent DNA ligase [Candidatus Dormibacteraeota bacterium]|nr:ATP-dependent DNA ligase [Candidatus Dormibacteraeota bacterium]
MKTPLPLDMEPMLSAISENGIPRGDRWEYEPKWDGFRTLVFRDGDEVALMSRGGRPMTRYFPEILPAFRALKEKKYVLDGELVVVGANGLDFGALQQRVHPAESRVRMLSEATPSWFIAFDIIAEGEQDLRKESLGDRRKRLEKLLKGVKPPLFLTPYTRDPKTAEEWFEKFEGAGLDGVIAKSWDGPYVPGKRFWVKIKHQRTADCVVIGWRKTADGSTLGALLLGLYDKKGSIHYVGHTSSFSAAERKELIKKLKPFETEIPESEWSANPGRMPGGMSRWSRGKKDTGDWVAVEPKLVCEVSYDKLEAGERFRHATGFLRWRTDKPPKKCTFEQILSVAQFDVRGIFGSK